MLPLPSSTRALQHRSSSSCSRFCSNHKALHLLPSQAFHLQNVGSSKHKLKIAWIRGSEVSLTISRIRKLIFAGVSLSSGYIGSPSTTLNEEVYRGIVLLSQGTSCCGGFWPIGVNQTPSSTGGILNMAITISTHQESPEHNGLAMLIGTAESPVPHETTEEACLSLEMDKCLGNINDTIALLNERNEGCLLPGCPGEISEESAILAKDDSSINLEAKEKLRRQRISIANKGKSPWNKGKQHSEETKNRIRESVTMKMQDPKLRERLRRQAEGVKTRPETLLKRKIGIRNAWKEKRRIKTIQEMCVIEWKSMIAEAARKGEEGETSYEWDSYISIRRCLRSASKPEKKNREVVRRGNLSTEHRLKISEAIKAKWSDPSYRETVKQGVVNAEKKRTATLSNPRSQKKYAHHRPVHKTKSHTGVSKDALMRRTTTTVNRGMRTYKDSEAEMKLEKLKSMRAKRVALEEIKRRDVTERARVLIAQAEEAAKALEAVVTKDKSALAPLLETRRLLAEAVHSIESTTRQRHRQPLDNLVMGKDQDIH